MTIVAAIVCIGILALLVYSYGTRPPQDPPRGGV